MNINFYVGIVEDTNCASIISLLIKDMKDYNNSRPIPIDSEDRRGFEKAIEFVENIYKEIEDIY